MAVAALAIAGCDRQPDHAEWQTRCIASHTEMKPDLLFFPDGRGGMSTMPTVTPEDHCDSWGRVCVPGRDGSTACPSL